MSVESVERIESVEQEIMREIDTRVERRMTMDESLTMQLVAELSKISDTLRRNNGD